MLKSRSIKSFIFIFLHVFFKNLNRNLYENIVLCNTFFNSTKFVKISVHWFKNDTKTKKTVHTFLNQTLTIQISQVLLFLPIENIMWFCFLLTFPFLLIIIQILKPHYLLVLVRLNQYLGNVCQQCEPERRAC